MYQGRLLNGRSAEPISDEWPRLGQARQIVSVRLQTAALPTPGCGRPDQFDDGQVRSTVSSRYSEDRVSDHLAEWSLFLSVDNVSTFTA
jgi:hypothetical protein